MSQLIHVGNNKLKDKSYKELVQKTKDLFKDKYPDKTQGGYFQHLPLEDFPLKLQKKVKEALRDDVMEYAFTYLVPPDSEDNQPVIKLSGLSSVKLIKQKAYDSTMPMPDLEYESKGLKNLSTCITIIWHLNDIEDGGLEFTFQEIMIQPSDKEVVVFPSYFTHTHQFHPASTDKFFLITTFYTGG